MEVITGKGNEKYRKSKFTIENDGPFIGWTNGSKASGWDVPLFEKEEADKIINDLNVNFNKEEEFVKYNENNDSYIFPFFNGDETKEFKGFIIDTYEGEKKVYAIGEDGDYGWTWEENIDIVEVNGTVLDVANVIKVLMDGENNEVLIVGEAAEEVSSSVIKTLTDFKVPFVENALNDETHHIKIF